MPPQSADAPAQTWFWVFTGVAVLAIIFDRAPWLGGWLLLLIVAGLALSPRGRSIITGSSGGVSRSW